MPDLFVGPSPERAPSLPTAPGPAREPDGASPLGIADPDAGRLVRDTFLALDASGARLQAFTDQAARDGWPAAIDGLRRDGPPLAEQLADVLATLHQAGWVGRDEGTPPPPELAPPATSPEATSPEVGLRQDPDRGWNQRLLPDGRTEMRTGSGATVRSFAEQFDVSETAAARWFESNGLRAYLPREAGGIRGALGRQDYPAVPPGTRIVLDRPMRPDIHTLSGPQIAAQLGLAIEDSLAHGSDTLSIPHYFKGTGRGQDNHLRVGEGTVNNVPLERATLRIDETNLPVSRLEVPVNTDWMDRISLTPHFKYVEPVDPAQPGRTLPSYNVEFRADNPAAHSTPELVVQFRTREDANRFVNLLTRGQ